jgi:hypothetical protein
MQLRRVSPIDHPSETRSTATATNPERPRTSCVGRPLDIA